jgi:hypothetical protein
MQYGMIKIYVLLMAELLAWVQGLEFALSQGQPSKFLEIDGLEVLLFVHVRNGHWTSGQNQVAERSSYGLHLPSCGDLRHIFAQFCQTTESIVYIVC